MIFIILGILFLIIAAVVYILKDKPKEIIPHEVEEISLDKDICRVINQEEITPNKSLILGVDKGIIIFNNDEVVYKEDSYSINYDSIVDFFDITNPDESNNKDRIDETEVSSKSIMTCYKVKKGPIKDIEAQLKNSNYYFDNFYNVLVQLEISLRATYEIIDYSKFLKDFVLFRKRYSLEKFKEDINKEIESKVYASISSYIQSNEISYLHVSLYKHEIEETVTEDINEFLSILGIRITRLTFTDISNIEDEYFQKLSKGILEKSKMSIINYSYKDKMNNNLGIIEDELHIEEKYKETKVFIKDIK